MEKDIGKIKKNDDTDIIIRVDDFGGSPGLTIREFVNKSESGFTGFTKAGVRIKADKFEDFKKMINSVDLKSEAPPKPQTEPSATDDENSGIDESGLM